MTGLFCRGAVVGASLLAIRGSGNLARYAGSRASSLLQPRIEYAIRNADDSSQPDVTLVGARPARDRSSRNRSRTGLVLLL